MKRCPVCNQTYPDDSLNFCLSDGTTLNKVSEDAPPTIFMDRPRDTGQHRWTTQNDPFSAPPTAPAAPWQNQGVTNNPAHFMTSQSGSQNQTLPIISLVLGVLGIVLICCFGGFPFGIAALITGYLGYNNVNNNPREYGGRSLAIGGMVLGGVSLAGALLMVILSAFN